MKKFKQILLIVLLIPCLFLISGCSIFEKEPVYVTGIVQGETIEGKTTYVVQYSNGQTSLFSVNNGKDGENGENLTIESIESYCAKKGIDFKSFLKEYLTVVQHQQSVQDAANVSALSSVSVWCEFPVISGYTKYNQLTTGSGVIYKMEDEFSYILTNYHVVYWYDCQTENDIAKNITIFQFGTSNDVYKTNKTENGYPVYEYGDGAIQAEYIGGSMTYDLALLKVNTADLLTYNEHAKAVTIASDYELGETAIAIGNPEALGFSVTSGIVSVKSEELRTTGADDLTIIDFRVMRIDTAINSGNSGGGLFNINGELIGIVNIKAVSSDIDNIAFAIPHDNVTAVADNILHYYLQDTTQPSSVKILNPGMKYSGENSRALYNPTTKRTTIKEDVIVSQLTVGYANNIRIFIGDIITKISINGVETDIIQAHQVEDLMLTIREDDKVIITVKRGNSLVELGSASVGVSAMYLEEVI